MSTNVKMKQLLTGTLLLFTCWSCVNSHKKETCAMEQLQEIYGPSDSLFYYIPGTYQGHLPSQDTTGIRTTLILNPDNTVYLHCENPHKGNSIFNEKGIFSLEQDTLLITMEGDQQINFIVKNHTLKMLNRNKKEINGLLKDLYVFTKNKD